jgi:hypothetical protein
VHWTLKQWLYGTQQCNFLICIPQDVLIPKEMFKAWKKGRGIEVDHWFTCMTPEPSWGKF